MSARLMGALTLGPLRRSLHLAKEAGPSRIASMAAFSTSSGLCAAQTKKAGKPTSPQKKRMVLQKNTRGAEKGGARGKGKRGGGGGGGSGSIRATRQFVRNSPFYKPEPRYPKMTEYKPAQATELNEGEHLRYTKRSMAAISKANFGVQKSMGRQFAQDLVPRTILRPSTLTVIDMLDKASHTAYFHRFRRHRNDPYYAAYRIFEAPVGFGMSTLLVQAVSYARERNWLTIYLPRTIRYVDSSSPYVYSEAHQTYIQPEITRKLLRAIHDVNREQLKRILLQDDHLTLGDGIGKVEKGTSLATLAEKIVQVRPRASPDTLHAGLETIMRCIIQQKEIPVLFAIDGLQGLFSKSLYRDPDYRQLQSYELNVPRVLQSCLRTSGPGSYGGVRRGAVLAAMSVENTKWPVPPEMSSAFGVKPVVDPHTKMDETMLSIAKECPFQVKNFDNAVLTRAEAASLLELTTHKGGMWSSGNDEMLMTKLMESGGNMAVFRRSLTSSLI